MPQSPGGSGKFTTSLPFAGSCAGHVPVLSVPLVTLLQGKEKIATPIGGLDGDPGPLQASLLKDPCSAEGLCSPGFSIPWDLHRSPM